MMRWLLDLVWPMCPSGMPHRVCNGVVTNSLGHQFCWHQACMQANNREIAASIRKEERAELVAAIREALTRPPADETSGKVG